jgi:hypothetical protein
MSRLAGLHGLSADLTVARYAVSVRHEALASSASRRTPLGSSRLSRGTRARVACAAPRGRPAYLLGYCGIQGRVSMR